MQKEESCTNMDETLENNNLQQTKEEERLNQIQCNKEEEEDSNNSLALDLAESKEEVD